MNGLRVLGFGSSLWLLGCAGGVQGAAKVALTVRSCPEVTQLAGQAATSWGASLGIEKGDAEALKTALAGAKVLESRTETLDERLEVACSGLASELGAAPAGGDAAESCKQAQAELSRAKAELGPEASVAAQQRKECTAGCSQACDLAAPTGPCARTKVIVAVSLARDEQAALRYSQAVERFLVALVALHDVQADVMGTIASARSAVEVGLVTGNAVSDGDLASAAASAACILPPLLRAKQHLSRLRRDLRLMGEMSKLAGLELPRPPTIQDPVVAHVSKEHGAPPTVAPPLDGRVLGLFAFPDGGFAAQTPQGVVLLPGGEMLLRTRSERQIEVSIGIGTRSPHATYCAVGARRRVACLRTQGIFSGNGQRVGERLVLLDSATGERQLAQVSSRGAIVPGGAFIDSAGQVLYAYTLQEQRGKDTVRYSRLGVGAGEQPLPFEPEAGALEELGGGGRAAPPVTFVEYQGRRLMFYRSGRELRMTPLDALGYVSTLATRSSYDLEPIVGGDGVLYVFYYEPKSRSARVAFTRDGHSFSDLVLDTRESGWQLDAVATEDGVIVSYYYFRNPYNKGLRAAFVKQGQLQRPPQSVVLEDRWNAGWHPYLVKDVSGATYFTYLSNVEAGLRAWSLFKRPQELLDHETKTTEPDYKNWFVQAGAGGWYTWWNLASPAPEAKEVDGETIHDASYSVEPSLLLSANLEARIGPLSLGLMYAQNYLDEEAKSLGEINRLLSGNLQIEDLLPGHDVKVEGVWGRYHGSTTRDVEGTAPEQQALDTSYLDVRLFALNQWRIKYGLTFNRFEVPTPLFTYYAGENATRYDYGGSVLRNVAYNNIDLAVGYSKLDYLAKYENDYFGPILDGGLALGVSIVGFDAVQTPVGETSSDFGFNVRCNVQAGWLAMTRFRALAGFGVYVRPSYSVEAAGFSNFVARPEDRKADDAKGASQSAKFELWSLRHGPWLDAGIVW